MKTNETLILTYNLDGHILGYPVSPSM